MDVLKFTTLIIAVLSIYSCSNPIDRNEFNSTGFKVGRFVPSTEDKYLYTCENQVNEFSKILDIYPLTNGFDSIQFRLWIDDDKICSTSFYSESLLIIKKYKQEPWKAVLIKFGIGDKVKDTAKIMCYEIKNLKPKNWNHIVKGINYLNLNKWVGSTAFSLDKYSGGTADGFMTLEIATTKQYRLITHYAPRHVLCEEQECKEVREFLSLLMEEFNLAEFRYYLGEKQN
jgi:hypothetical protein